MLSNFTIVMLYKNKYNLKHVTKADPTPRLLIIRTYERWNQYIVRYPDGNTERINECDIRLNTTYTIDHPSYKAIASNMPAIEQEFRRNEVFQNFLTTHLPNYAIYLHQLIDAKNHAKAERSKPQPFTIADQIPQIELPTPTQPEPSQPEPESTTASESEPTLIQVLQSIDQTLKAML